MSFFNIKKIITTFKSVLLHYKSTYKNDLIIIKIKMPL